MKLNPINTEIQKYKGYIYLKLIFICFTFYVCVRGLTGSYYIPDGTIRVSYQVGGNTFATIVLYLGLVISIMLGIRGYVRSISFRYIIASFIIFIPIFVWSVFDMINGHTLRSLLGISTICPFTFFLLFAANIGMNPAAWNKVVDICNVLSIGFVVMSVVFTVKFCITYGFVPITNSPQIIFLSIGFIPLAIRVLLSEKTFNAINILLLTASLMCAIFYNSRGWVLQLVMLSVCYFFVRNKQYTFLKKTGFVLLCSFLLIIVYYIVLIVMPDRFESLLNKFGTGLASRTWQYDDLLSQYTFFDLFFGKGSFAVYDTGIYGTFMYFDNAFVNISMKYGVGVALIFLIILLRTPLKLLLSKKDVNKKYPAIIILLFFVAIMGLSVYFVVSVDLKLFLVFIILGRCEYLYNSKSFMVRSGK